MENIPDTPEGIILESLLEGMNQYFSAELSQKVKRGMKESRRKGLYTGGYIVYGYKVENQKFVINEDQAEIVRYIFSEAARGRMVTTILEEIREKGLLNQGRPFSKNSLYKILSNDKYIGVFRCAGEVYTDTYPRIVSDEVFQIVKQRMEQNKYVKHKEDVYYLMKFKMNCGYCGKPVHSDAGTSHSGSVTRYYTCTNRRKNKSCDLLPVRKEIIEETVVNSLLKVFTDDDNMDNIATQIVEKINKENGDCSIFNELQNQMATVEKSLQNLFSIIEEGLATESIKMRVLALEDKKNELATKMAVEKNKQKQMLKKQDVLKYFQKAIKKDARPLVKLLLREAKLYNDKIELYLNYTDDKKPDGENHQAFLLYKTSYTVEYYFREGCRPQYKEYYLEFFV